MGAITGIFSVSEDKQVWFSKGNLQYQASSRTWRFAEQQYDFQGSPNSNISSSYSGWIDLFGWATSGWYCGNPCYRPYDWNGNGNEFGPPAGYNLTESYANCDWGVNNAISNGGNVAGQWRTLTRAEWDYVLFDRPWKRFAKACVNGNNGLIVLPDNWSYNTYSLNNCNSLSASYDGNVISSSDWNIIENAGAVFLPAAGRRGLKTVTDVNSVGAYWSSSYFYGSDDATAANIYINNGYVELSECRRQEGFSVRLVRDVQ